jgi:hypothetical protein
MGVKTSTQADSPRRPRGQREPVQQNAENVTKRRGAGKTARRSLAMNLYRTCIWVAVSLLGPSLLLAGTAHADVPNEPPSVSITSPTDGQMFEGPTATIDVVLDAFGGDEGINSVRLLVDATPVMIDDAMPWGFEGVEIAEGMHTLEAVVVSAADGDEFSSGPVEIVVLGAAGETGGTSSGESSAGESSAGESSGGTSEEPKGCSVGSGTQIGAGLVLVCLFGLSFAGRRREG